MNEIRNDTVNIKLGITSVKKKMDGKRMSRLGYLSRIQWTKWTRGIGKAKPIREAEKDLRDYGTVM